MINQARLLFRPNVKPFLHNHWVDCCHEPVTFLVIKMKALYYKGKSAAATTSAGCGGSFSIPHVSGWLPVFLLGAEHANPASAARSSTGLCIFLQIFEHLGRENKSVAEIERPCPDWQWTKDRVALTEKMTLPLLCTSSPPGGDPRTSTTHAGCHSRRMTSFSSTMPFPPLTLNCHTPTPPPPLLHLLHISPACRASLFGGHARKHDHACALVHEHTPVIRFFVWLAISGKLQGQSSSHWLMQPVSAGPKE